MGVHHVVLALSLREPHHRHVRRLGETEHRGLKRPRHRRHQRTRRERRALMRAEELRHPTGVHQPWLVQVQIEPVDRLHLQRHPLR
jgi:hypothetical protein